MTAQTQSCDDSVAGLWNLSLCYERGVGVTRDLLVARALQQQCHECEGSQSQRLGAGRRASPSIAGGPATQARSSDVFVSAADGQRCRMSSAIAATPPPPTVPPPRRPTSETTASDKLLSSENALPEAKSVSKSEPKPAGETRESAQSETTQDVNRPESHLGVSKANTNCPVSLTPKERKDSMLLRPTPEAIARVKAAVERRRALEEASRVATASTE